MHGYLRPSSKHRKTGIKMMNRSTLLILSALFLGCSASNSRSDQTDATGSDAEGGTTGGGDIQGASVTEDGDTLSAPAQDTFGGSEDSAPRPNDGARQADVASGPPPTGDVGIGGTCTWDGECQSGICWATALGSGCTPACESMADCESYGLLCLEVRPGRGGCAPETVTASDECQSHYDCTYPLYCRDDMGWCDFPGCTWDADCEDGEICESDTRRCQVIACTSETQCHHPEETCLDSTCGPPECVSDEACAVGDACHPIQHSCYTPTACTSQEECYYNELCDSGGCIYHPCFAGCTGAGESCDPTTGLCGGSCSGSADCPEGRACGALGICYINTPPHANATVNGASGATVSVGSTVTFDSEASSDAEGGVFSHDWVLNATPPGSPLLPFSSLGTASTATLTPNVAGLYMVALWVIDEGGLVSMQDQAMIIAE
jgi:hypothetical protein